MLRVQYKHQLHGMQELSCHTLVKTQEGLHAKNIHGATFQLLEAGRIVSVASKEGEQHDNL